MLTCTLEEEERTMDTELEIQRIIVQHCRFCAEEKKADELVDISNDEVTLELHTVMEYFKIDFIDFSNMAMPQTTCVDCYNKIVDSHRLFEKIKESQIALFELYCLKKEDYSNIIKEEDNLDLSKIKETVTVRSRQSSVTNSSNHDDNTMMGHQSSEEFEMETNDKTLPAFNGIIYYLGNPVCNNDDILKSFTIVENSSEVSPILVPKLDDDYDDTVNNEENLETSKSPAINSKKTEGKDKKLVPKSDDKYDGIVNNEENLETSKSPANNNKKTERKNKKFVPKSDDKYDGIVNNEENLETSKSPANNNKKTECKGSKLVLKSDNKYDGIVNNEENLETSKSPANNNKKAECKDNKLVPKSDDNDNNIINNGKNPETSKTAAIQNEKTKCEDDINSNIDNISWNIYRWCCNNCGMECDSMEDVRAHGLQLHKRCYAFKCVDCDDLVYPSFECFIEHVRQHNPELWFYCPHCNERFQTIPDCLMHTSTHLSDGQQMCRWCGKIFLNGKMLSLHKSLTKRVKCPRELYRKFTYTPRRVTSVRNLQLIYGANWESVDFGTWDDYEWTCQECSVRCSSVQLLRKHSQEVHGKCFLMKCADCPLEATYFRFFANHVSIHRPHLNVYCPYCNRRLKDRKSVAKHIIEDHFAGPLKPCNGCGQIFDNIQLENQHYKQFEPTIPNSGPRRVLTTKDLTCEICNKVFKHHIGIKTHKKLHDKNRKKEHVCDTCGKQFYDEINLRIHLLTHEGVKNFVCKVCDSSFISKKCLRKHVLTHLQAKKLICDHCGKQYYSKSGLSTHMLENHIRKVTATAADIKKKYKCQVCCKTFKTSQYLRNHMNIHDANRRIQCQNCEKTFTNWGNCNKHMKRIHKTTLAKTKRTPHGRVLIDKIEEVQMNAQVNKQWMEDVVKLRA